MGHIEILKELLAQVDGIELPDAHHKFHATPLTIAEAVCELVARVEVLELHIKHPMMQMDEDGKVAKVPESPAASEEWPVWEGTWDEENKRYTLKRNGFARSFYISDNRYFTTNVIIDDYTRLLAAHRKLLAECGGSEGE
jgi:hypothetical protein